MDALSKDDILREMNEIKDRGSILLILVEVLQEWPVYDMALMDSIGRKNLHLDDEKYFSKIILRRLRAFMDILETDGFDPIHLPSEENEEFDLVRIATALLWTPFRRFDCGRIRLDRGEFYTRLSALGMRWKVRIPKPDGGSLLYGWPKETQCLAVAECPCGDEIKGNICG